MLRSCERGVGEVQLRADLRAAGRAARLGLPAEHGLWRSQDLHHTAGRALADKGGDRADHFSSHRYYYQSTP